MGSSIKLITVEVDTPLSSAKLGALDSMSNAELRDVVKNPHMLEGTQEAAKKVLKERKQKELSFNAA